MPKIPCIILPKIAFLSTILFVESKLEDKIKSLFNYHSQLNGHWGYFKQNFSEYPIENPLGTKIIAQRAFEFLFLPKDEVLKFLSVETRPHLFIERDEKGFTIWGPLYSIVFEAARHINYSINGISLAQEDQYVACLNFKPDFLIALIWPQLDYFKYVGVSNPFGLAAFGIEQIAWMTSPISLLEIDYVLYFKRKQPRDLFAFITIFSTITWIGIFLSAFSVALLLSICERTKCEAFKSHLFNSLASIIIFNSRFKLKDKLLAIKLVVLVWITITMILQLYFGGDMFAQLAMDPKPDVIDSVEDLVGKPMALRSSNFQLIKGQNAAEAARDYFNKERGYYEDLTKRLVMMNMTEMTDMKMMAKSVLGAPDEPPETDTCLMTTKAFAEYMKNILNDGMYRDIAYISKEGADSQFHTFGRMFSADPKESAAMDFVIIHLNEAGIYQKWLDVVLSGLYRREERKVLVSFVVSELRSFLGPAIVCGLGVLISTTAIFLECLLLFVNVLLKR